MMSLAVAGFPFFLSLFLIFPPLADMLGVLARRRSPSHCSGVARRVGIGITVTYAPTVPQISTALPTFYHCLVLPY